MWWMWGCVVLHYIYSLPRATLAYLSSLISSFYLPPTQTITNSRLWSTIVHLRRGDHYLPVGGHKYGHNCVTDHFSRSMDWWDNVLTLYKYFSSFFSFSPKIWSWSLPFNRLLGHPKRHTYVPYHVSPPMHWWNNALTPSKRYSRQTDICWWSQHPPHLPKGRRDKNGFIAEYSTATSHFSWTVMALLSWQWGNGWYMLA